MAWRPHPGTFSPWKVCGMETPPWHTQGLLRLCGMESPPWDPRGLWRLCGTETPPWHPQGLWKGVAWVYLSRACPQGLSRQA